MTATHLSIGEVLSLLQDEFPDITISKIRFLESQGLLDPERSPSGYRKFFPHDIERLRWILQQQRDNFLPLRVIKGKLEDPAPDEEGAGSDGSDQSPSAEADRAAPLVAGPAAGAMAGEGTTSGTGDFLDSRSTSVSLTLDELATAASLDVSVVVELEQYGLVVPHAIGQARYYDEEALAVANLAAAFRVFGVEARHLRMFKTAADREAGVYEQMILPLARQRDPDAQRRARDSLGDLAQLGESVHRAMLRQALRPHLDS